MQNDKNATTNEGIVLRIEDAVGPVSNMRSMAMER
jgi:hypothetical protein